MRAAVVALAVVAILAFPAAFGLRLAMNSTPASPGRTGEVLATRPPPDFSAFARGWRRHGMTLSIDVSGRGDASWRIYKWCSDDPTPPCDERAGDTIINGGRATLIFTSLKGSTAVGRVNSSTDARVLPNGPVSITIQPYEMARLDPPGVTLCGPHFEEQAPAEIVRSSPCGA